MALLQTAPSDAWTPSYATVAARPGFAERLFVVGSMLLYAVALPQDWFSVIDVKDSAGNANESTGALASVAFLGIGVIAFLVVLPRLHLVFQLARIAPALTTLGGYLLLSTLWSSDPATTGRRALGVALTVFVAMYLVIRFDRDEILRYGALASALSVWLNAAFVIGLPRYGVMADGRWDGLFLHKNQLGLNATFYLLLLLLQVAGAPRSRIWAVPSLVMAGILLIGSTSKTALSASVLLLGLLVVYQLFRARRVLFGAVAVSLAAASVAAVLFVTANLPFFAEILDKDITLSGRTKLWGLLLGEISKRPLLGYGYDGFWRGWFSPAHDVWIAADWRAPTAHNAALDYLLDLGVIGLALVLAYFLSALVRATRDLRDTPGAIGTVPIAVLSYQLLFSITESGVITRSLPWLMICAMVFSVALAQTGERQPVADLEGSSP